MSDGVFIGVWSGPAQDGGLPSPDRRGRQAPSQSQTATILFLTESDLPADMLEHLRKLLTDGHRDPDVTPRPAAAALPGAAPASAADACEVILFDQLEIDTVQRRVRWAERPLELSGQELELLALLAARAGRAYSFTELFERVWGARYRVDPLVAHSAVRRLRRKLAAEAVGVVIESVRGYGFRLARRV